jgi:class I fructose-bisphosphate aldolase
MTGHSTGMGTGTGKRLRLGRFLGRGKALIVPIDHGLTVGPLSGIGSAAEIGAWIDHAAIDGVVAHKGMIERLVGRDHLLGKGVMVHLNGMPSFSSASDDKEALTGVEAAARLGADAVSIQLNFAPGNERANIRYLGAVRDEADAMGLPVLVMLYDKAPTSDVPRQRHLMRLCIELGTDMLKIGMPESADVAALFSGLSDDIPIFVAGGGYGASDELLRSVRTALNAGAAGVCIGRNAFQRADPGAFCARLRSVLDAAKLQPALRPVRDLEDEKARANAVSHEAH